MVRLLYTLVILLNVFVFVGCGEKTDPKAVPANPQSGADATKIAVPDPNASSS